MLLSFTARDLVLVSWRVDPDRVRRVVPQGLEPALAGGAALVSMAGLRNEDVRLRGRRVPGFSQLNVRTYVTRDGEPGVFFLSLRVTVPGLGGALLGAPLRPARIRVADGMAEASGLGVSLRYRSTGERPGALPDFGSGLLGSHDVGYFVSAGLRRIVAEHDPFAWESAELTAPPRFDPVLAFGFDAAEPDSLLYAAATAFRTELPAARVA